MEKITLFSIPKAFRKHIDIIQRNAIESWIRLGPACEIILLGDDEGTADVAKAFNLTYESDIPRNEFGTPIVNAIFEKAQARSASNLLCYVNADIILMNDFVTAVERVAAKMSKFLMVGQRWDIDINQPLDFSQGWENRLRSLVLEKGQLHPQTGIDYFVFPRGLWGQIPPFAIGRTVWDNWLIYQARSRWTPVVDLTPVVMSVHQNHDYSHLSPKAGGDAWTGLEAQRNLELCGGYKCVFTIEDATRQATPQGIKFSIHRGNLQRHLNVFSDLHPHFSFFVSIFRIFLRVLTKLELLWGKFFKQRGLTHAK